MNGKFMVGTFLKGRDGWSTVSTYTASTSHLPLVTPIANPGTTHSTELRQREVLAHYWIVHQIGRCFTVTSEEAFLIYEV